MAVYYNDNDEFVCDWLENLIREKLLPAGVVDRRPIQEVEPKDVQEFTQCHFFAGIGGWAYALQLAGWPEDRPAWTGSCPCGPWSVAGKRLGANDARHVWPFWFHLIAECRPPVVFGEQVTSPDGSAWLAAVSADLEGVEYAFGAADLCAAGVGAPHARPRFFWVADADDTRREGAEWARESGAPRQGWPAACRESLRPVGRHWPPGPGEVHAIPLLDNGLPGVVGACKGYGNAIVPQVAAAFVSAYLELGESPSEGRAGG